MRCSILLVALAACGGNTVPKNCQPAQCPGGAAYRACVESATTVRYEFGSGSCTCTGAGECAACNEAIETFCEASFDGGAGSPQLSIPDLAGSAPQLPDLSVAPDLAPLPPGNMDQPPGASCAQASDCSSDYCYYGICSCNKPDRGYVCKSDSDCCAPGQCVGGLCYSQSHVPGCVAPSGGCGGGAACCFGVCDSGSSTCVCSAGGGGCSSDEQCCTGGCSDPNPAGYRVCVQRKIAQQCVYNADCFSNNCVGGECACAAPGYDACTSNDDCCSGLCNLGNSVYGTCS